MTRKCFILLPLLILWGFSACQKLTEDPKEKLTPITYFQSQKDLDGAVAACYECYAHDYGYGSPVRMNICFGSDDLAAPHGSDKIWARLYDELKGYPTDGGANTCWNPFWKGIYQANNVIANYKMVPSIDDLKNASAAQAYFLRAWAYYMLVRSFGSVPLVLGSTDVSVKLPRAAVNDVYALIVSDLQTAINLFPASFPSLPDRTNPLAAKALLTDVYLTMTGWPLNDANKYASAAATGYCCQKYRIEH